METFFSSSDNPDISFVLKSCDPEIQDLMKRMEIMSNHQREEWQAERSQWDVQLKSAQQEIVSLGNIIKRRDREMELLRKQLEDSQMDRQETVSTYEHQLQRLRKELDKLKRSYLKLQRKTLKDKSGVKDSDFIKLPPAGCEQNTSVPRTSPDHQRLLHEVATMNQLLQAKDDVIRSLEDCLSAQGCAGVETLRQQLETTASKLQGSRTCEDHLRAQLARLKKRLDAVSRHGENSQMELELKSLKAQYDSSVTQIQKLGEELHSAKQTHGAEVRGLRMDVSKLTNELHQRDLAIAELSGAHLKTTRQHLDTFQTENQWRRSLLHSPETSDSSPRKTSHVSELTALDKYEHAVLSGALTERLQPAEDRLQQNEADPRRAASEQSGAGCEAEIRRLCDQLRALSPSLQLVCEDGRPQSSSFSPPSRSRTAQSHTNPVPASERPPPPLQDLITLPPSSVDVGAPSPAQVDIGPFLEEESLRCNELQHKLDEHIQGLRESNYRTVSKYLTCAPGPPHAVEH